MIVHSSKNPIIINEGLFDRFKKKSKSNIKPPKVKLSNEYLDAQDEFAKWAANNIDSICKKDTDKMKHCNPNDDSDIMKTVMSLANGIKRDIAWENKIPITVLQFGNDKKKVNIAFIHKSWGSMITDPTNVTDMGIPFVSSTIPFDELLEKLKEGQHDKPIANVSLGVEVYWDNKNPNNFSKTPKKVMFLVDADLY